MSEHKIIFKNPKYGIINERCSKIYPGAKVRILQYLDTVDQYEVKNEESHYTYWINADGINIIE